MRKTLLGLLAILLILSLLGNACAEEPSPVTPNARIRVSAPSVVAGKIIGTVVTLGTDTLVLKPESAAANIAVALVSVEQLDVSRGQKSRFWTGAGIGFLIGAAIGAVAGQASAESLDTPTGAATAAFAGFGGIAGGTLGGLMGFSAKTDRWEEVPLEHIQADISLGGGTGFMFSLSFAF